MHRVRPSAKQSSTGLSRLPNQEKPTQAKGAHQAPSGPSSAVQSPASQSPNGQSSFVDPSRAATLYQQWRAQLGQSPQGDPGAQLDRPDLRLIMLRVFGETRRLSQACMTYPQAAADALLEGPDSIIGATARKLTSLNRGVGSAQKLHDALTPLKDSVDLAISLAVLSGTWDVHRASSARTDFAERLCDTVLAWLVRAAVKRGELSLASDEDANHEAPKDKERESSQPGITAGLFMIAGHSFAHEDIAGTGPLDLVCVYEPDLVKPGAGNSNERALIRIGAELRDVMEGSSGSYPLYHLTTPFGSKLNGAGLMEARSAIERQIGAPQSEILRSWFATARIVAGDRDAGGDFLEHIDATVWNDGPLLTHETTQTIRLKTKSLFPAYQAISDLCRLTLGKARPAFRTASTHDVFQTAGTSNIIAAPLANRLMAGFELANLIDVASLAVCGERLNDTLFKASEEAPDPRAENIANLCGFGDANALGKVMEGLCADAANGLDQLLYGPREAYCRYNKAEDSQDGSGNDQTSDDKGKLEALGFMDGHSICEIVESWLSHGSPETASEEPRFAARAPGLLTAFGATQYPGKAIELLDKLLVHCPDDLDLFSVLEKDCPRREQLIDGFGNFPFPVAALFNNGEQIGTFLSDFLSPDTLGADSQLGDGAPPLNSPVLPASATIEALGQWRTQALAQTAFDVAGRRLDAPQAIDALKKISDLTLTTLFDILKRTEFRGEKKLHDTLTLFHCHDQWRSVPGDHAVIGFILARRKADKALEGLAEKFAQRFIEELEQIGAGPFSISIDVSHRPDGASGSLAAMTPKWEDYVRTQAVAADQICLARARVIAGAKAAQETAQRAIREVLSNERRMQLTLRDLDRARNQHRTRNQHLARGDQRFSAGPSLWETDSVEGGYRDINMIINVLIYRFGGAHPYLQEMDTGEALGAMAQADLIDASVATTLADAREFWLSLNLMRAWSGWSSPDVTPIRARLGALLADGAGVRSFARVAPLIRGFIDDGNRLYGTLIQGQNDRLSSPR